MAARIKRLKPSEDDIQRQIVGFLHAMRYQVLVTSRRVKRCVQCGHWGMGADGATRGIPDLLVRHPSWPRYVWVGVEVKTPTGRVRPEQQALADVGAVVVVRSLNEVMALHEKGW